MRTRSCVAATTLMVAVAGSLSACGVDGPDDAPAAEQTDATPTPSPQETSQDPVVEEDTDEVEESDEMRIEIIIGDQRFEAELDDSAASVPTLPDLLGKGATKSTISNCLIR